MIRKILGKLLYAFFIHMPESFEKPNLGQRFFRGFCGKLILKNCGKKVNIEKGAKFSSEVELGDYSGIGVNARLNGKVVIGNYVMMGPNCTCITRNHCFESLEIPYAIVHNSALSIISLGIGNIVQSPPCSQIAALCSTAPATRPSLFIALVKYPLSDSGSR